MSHVQNSSNMLIFVYIYIYIYMQVSKFQIGMLVVAYDYLMTMLLLVNTPSLPNLKNYSRN
jgi:hypothetical protein